MTKPMPAIQLFCEIRQASKYAFYVNIFHYQNFMILLTVTIKNNAIVIEEHPKAD